MSKREFITTRDITVEECSWLKYTVGKGSVFTYHTGHTYGCITPGGLPMEGVSEAVFTELPHSALKEVLCTDLS